ncbi:MAG: amino acid ABC transporter substrate-binding protein [Bacteroidetes bacterium]|nr:amino acid ABC transporter substrate-binding protein [Bacteroidota bacterium]
MISVQNLQRLLNGSKWILLGFFLLSLTTSCDLFKKLPDDDQITDTDDDLNEIQGPKQLDPETGEYETVTTLSEAMDTIKWTMNPASKYPPITSETAYFPTGNGETGVQGGPYRISMLLPFFTDRFYSASGEIYDNSEWALQFYSGSKMAMEQLTKEGAKLQFFVYDTKGTETTTNQILNSQPAISGSHMILGPYLSSNARVVAAFGKRNKIPAVIPYSPSSNLSDHNPYLVQVNPTFKSHAEAIVKQVRSNYDADQVVMVVPNKPNEIQRLEYFQEANYEFMGSVDSTARFEEFIVMDESADLKDTKIGPYLRAEKKTIFIIPTWNDESFVYSFLRKLKIAQAGFSEVEVYGMPQWMYFEQIDYSLYEDLNLHVSNFFHIDEYSQDIKDFKTEFFEIYGTVPNEEAYVGYGTTLYFGRLLNQYGADWLNQLDAADGVSLHTQYQFRKVVDPGTSSDAELLNTTKRYENQFLHILKFEDYHFQRVEE